MLKSERFSTYSHLFVAILCMIALIVISIKASYNPAYQFVSALACAMAVLSMGSSAYYHSQKQSENEENWRRKLDHIAIFFIIAGFFTALSYFYLDAPWKWMVIGIEWAFVIAGFFLKLFYLNSPRWLTPTIYIVMGLTAIIPLPIYISKMTSLGITLLITGGIILISGGIIYGTKKPDPKPGIFGFHELFHVFIGIGIILFYIIIYDIVVTMQMQ